MSNLKTVEYLTSIIVRVHDINSWDDIERDTVSWDDMEKCVEVAHNAAIYALSLPEDERKAFADALAGIKEGGEEA